MATNNNKQAKPTSEGGDPLPLNLMKSLRRGKAGSESGSSSGGNNSEDSALVSLGNSSFGFNFDSMEGMANSSPPNSNEGSGNNSSSNSDQNSDDDGKITRSKPAAATKPPKSSMSSLTNSTSTSSNADTAHTEAANDAIATLQSIAERTYARSEQSKRKSPDSGGYASDDEAATKQEGKSSNSASPSKVVSESTSQSDDQPPKKKKRANDKKREERNAREKERSFRIAKQINELRDLLSSGGVVVPKGTKSSVLTEAANYIRMLQQHQYRSEM